jgi:hypothetical protein
MKKLRNLSSLLVLAIFFGQLSCGGTRPDSGRTSDAKQAPHFKPGINLFSPKQDVEMGRQSAVQISRQMPLMPENEPIVGYVRQLGAKLVAKAPGEKFPYTFNVVATKDVNAFALPGGFIFVNAGAIAAAKNEGELAGVMAHEIMHVALRHGTNQATKAYVAKAGLGILTSVLAGGDNPNMANVMATIGGAGANALFLKFGRTAEKESDLAGARMMAEAGYDPRDMAGFFKTLQNMSGGQRTPEFLSDHPDPGNRIASIEQIYKSLPVSSNPVRSTNEFETVKARLTGRQITPSKQLARVGPSDPTDMKPGTRPQPPSGNFRPFQAQDRSFALQHPDNWDVLAPGQSNYSFAPQGAYAQTGETLLVTHGIFIGVVPPLGDDLGSATRAFIQKQIEANPDFRIERQPQQINFGGKPGFVSVVVGPSTTTGVMEVDITYTTATADGRLFYIITIAPQDELQQYQATFERIIQSLQLAK